MKKSFILLIILLSACININAPKNEPAATATPQSCEKKKPIVIAVIDTGFGIFDKGHEVKLCQYGHKDFAGMGLAAENYGTKDPVPMDFHGHGTHIAGLIDKYAKQAGADYCLVIIRYFSDMSGNNDNLKATIKSFQYANQIGADIINYSGGGVEPSDKEKEQVIKFLDNGGIFYAAAGNLHSNLSEKPYYPAMYDKRIVIVGNLKEKKVRAPTSNYGAPVTQWEIGTEVESLGLTMTGTSQATAIATGKFVGKIHDRCGLEEIK